jgi:hypothetical protein
MAGGKTEYDCGARGARDTLRRFAPLIFFDHAPYVVAEKGYDPDEIAEILTGAGYHFTDLKRRSLTAGAYGLPDIKTGAGINLMALPEAGRQEALRARRSPHFRGTSGRFFQVPFVGRSSGTNRDRGAG